MKKIVATCAHCKSPSELRIVDFPGNYYPVNCPACGSENDIANMTRIIGVAAGLLALYVIYSIFAQFLNLSKEASLISLLLSVILSVWLSMLAASRFPRLVKYKRPLLTTAPPAGISPADRELMDRFGISHNGQYFVVREMHFDRLAEAADYARELRGPAV